MASYPHALPEQPVLAQAARALEDGQLAGEVLDSEWRLRYVSSELRTLIGYHDDDDLSYGTLGISRSNARPDVWRLDEESRRRWLMLDGPFLRADAPADPGWAEEHLGHNRAAFESLEPADPPIAWSGEFRTTFADGSPARVTRFVSRLVGPDGSLNGLLGLYVGGGLRGSVQAILSRGDERMYERMAALYEPARRPAAILFADVEASAVLSRKLSTTAYFDLVRRLTTEIDAAVIDNGGIVGKHVGDGVSAFFLADQCGGEDGASAAGIGAAFEIRSRIADLEAAGEPLEVNVGVHWGANAVIGQVVTGGRLEVTALGDEVNEAARVQDIADHGTMLATKDVLERLSAEAAAQLAFDPRGATYTILADYPGASEKARRDAGGLAVCDITPR